MHVMCHLDALSDFLKKHLICFNPVQADRLIAPIFFIRGLCAIFIFLVIWELGLEKFMVTGFIAAWLLLSGQPAR